MPTVLDTWPRPLDEPMSASAPNVPEVMLHSTEAASLGRIDQRHGRRVVADVGLEAVQPAAVLAVRPLGRQRHLLPVAADDDRDRQPFDP